MSDEFKIHQEARIKSGKYAGLVGTVIGKKPGAVRVKIEGVHNGELIISCAWWKISQVEHNHGQ